jgi:16S rRNA (uracil1498-N3)-methyltransferase
MKKIRALKVEGSIAYLNKKHAHVLRIKEGEKIKILLPSGEFALAEVVDSENMRAQILEFIPPVENKLKISIAIPLLKKEKTEKIVEYLSIIGVEKIIPVITRRSEVRPKDEKKLKIEQRLAKISVEYARISGVKPPEIEKIVSLEKLQDNQYQKKIVFYELSTKILSYDDLKNIISSSDKIIILIGPEGGFDEDEISYLRSRGWEDFSIGSKILTSELFPIYIISIFDFFSSRI